MRLGKQKKKALILSDMHGLFTDENQYVSYIKETERFFTNRNYNIFIASAPILAGISSSSVEKKHKQFLGSGIDCASNLLAGKNINYDLAIGFSIGGTILWEACKKKPDLVKNLVCVSSTRLRYETKKIKPKTHLLYGINDSYAPSIEILDKISDFYTIIANAQHEFYRKSVHAEAFKI